MEKAFTEALTTKEEKTMARAQWKKTLEKSFPGCCEVTNHKVHYLAKGRANLWFHMDGEFHKGITAETPANEIIDQIVRTLTDEGYTVDEFNCFDDDITVYSNYGGAKWSISTIIYVYPPA